MEYIESGSGSTRVVLVPGGPGLVPDFYADLTERLSRTTGVVSYTPRGTAPRPLEDFPRTITETADELEELVTALSQAGDDTRPIVLLGQSFGTAVAIEYLVSRQEHSPVVGAILASPFASGAMLRRGIESKLDGLPEDFHRRYNGGDTSVQEINALIGEYWYPTFFCRVPWPQSFVDAMSKLNPAFMGHYIGGDLFALDGALLSWDREAELRRISVPVLLLSGQFDYFRIADLERMRDGIPEAELVISEAASHTIWVEDPDVFYPSVERFLASL